MASFVEIISKHENLTQEALLLFKNHPEMRDSILGQEKVEDIQNEAAASTRKAVDRLLDNLEPHVAWMKDLLDDSKIDFLSRSVMNLQDQRGNLFEDLGPTQQFAIIQRALANYGLIPGYVSQRHGNPAPRVYINKVISNRRLYGNLESIAARNEMEIPGFGESNASMFYDETVSKNDGNVLKVNSFIEEMAYDIGVKEFGGVDQINERLSHLVRFVFFEALMKVKRSPSFRESGDEESNRNIGRQYGALVHTVVKLLQDGTIVEEIVSSIHNPARFVEMEPTVAKAQKTVVYKTILSRALSTIMQHLQS